MSSHADQERTVWRRIEQLFQLRAQLQREVLAGNVTLHTINIEDVESNLYEALVPQVKAVIRGFAYLRGREDVREEILNEAIGRLFQAYAGFKGEASLRTYCTTIVRNVVLSYLKKQRREQSRVSADDEEMSRMLDKEALDRFHMQDASPGSGELMAGSVDHILEAVDLRALGLTDKEFLAVVLKLASKCLLKQKVTDEEMARMLGMQRVTFVDAYLRGRDKICRHLKEKQTHGGQ